MVHFVWHVYDVAYTVVRDNHEISEGKILPFYQILQTFTDHPTIHRIFILHFKFRGSKFS